MQFLIRYKHARLSPYARNALNCAYDHTQVFWNPPKIRLKWTRIRLWSDSSAIDSLNALVVRSNLPLIRLQRDRIRLWSDSSALDSLYALVVRSNHPKIRPNISLRFKHSWYRLSCARNRFWSNSSALDFFHTLVVRSNPPMIRFKCARKSLCAFIALESTYDQTQVRSTSSFRSNRSRFRLNCARSHLWSESVALENVYDQIQVRRKPFMIRLSCARSRLWSNLGTLDSLHALKVRSNPPKVRLKYARQSFCARSLTGPESVALKAV